jgi:SAM-dependent methyltransferase
MLRDGAGASGTLGAGFERRAEPEELPELMDGPCSYEELRVCLRDLARVNRLMQGYAPTLQFLDRVVERFPAARPLRILDVGSGGGDMLRRVARWARGRAVSVELTGVDLNPYAARAAREFGARQRGAGEIFWVSGDVFAREPEERVDVVVSSLFTHHLSSAGVVDFLQWMEENARVGWFVNDLRRSAKAARWFGVLAAAMRWHKFVRHDGPVSLRRGFREEDWERLLLAAGIAAGAATIEAHPMARLCVARMR